MYSTRTSFFDLVKKSIKFSKGIPELIIWCIKAKQQIKSGELNLSNIETLSRFNHPIEGEGLERSKINGKTLSIFCSLHFK